MKIGTCVSEARILDSFAHADFLEIPARALFTMEQERFSQIKDAVDSGRLCAGAANCLIPNDLQLIGSTFNLKTLKDFCDPVFDRLAQLQVKTVVFGSGKAKNIPEGFPADAAWEQLIAICSLFAEIAAQYGQTVVAEPLSYGETNLINTVEQAAALAKAVAMPNFKYMVDFYHFDNNAEAPASLIKYGAGIGHAHIAAPKTRTLPQSEADWAFVRNALQLLKAIGYTGSLSFEGKAPDPQQTDRTLSVIKQLWNEVSA